MIPKDGTAFQPPFAKSRFDSQMFRGKPPIYKMQTECLLGTGIPIFSTREAFFGDPIGVVFLDTTLCSHCTSTSYTLYRLQRMGTESLVW